MTKNFLLTGYYFNGYHGSMMHICEIAEYLVAQGWMVGVVSMDITQEIREYVESKGIRLYSVHTLPKDIVWQYALCYHFPLLPYLLRSGVNIERFSIGSLSGIEMLESPSFLVKAEGLPVFVHCGSLKSKLILNHGINENTIFIVPNLVPESFREFEKKPPPQSLNKIAVVSSHVSNEIREAAVQLAVQHIIVDFYGLADKHIPVTPQLLAGYDCVVTIGKTVQYALALGIPVFNYDRFGGEGYIRLSNIDDEEYYNFSGRRTFRSLCADALAAELSRGFAAAAKEASSLRAVAYERYFVSYQVERILSILDGWAFHKIEESPATRMYYDYCNFIINEDSKNLNRISALQQAYDGVAGENTKALKQLDTLQQAYDGLVAENGNNIAQLAALQQAYNSIVNAFFWKMTKPLRGVANFIKGRKIGFTLKTK